MTASASKRATYGASTENPRRDCVARSYWVALFPLLSGCAGATGNLQATDPTERGLSYIAAAIVTAAVLRATFNK